MNRPTAWWLKNVATATKNSRFFVFITNTVPVYVIAFALCSLMPVTLYLLYKDSDKLQNVVKSGIKSGIKSGKDLYPAIYPAIYVSLHLCSLSRVFSDPQLSPIQKVLEVETYLPTVAVQTKKVVNYYKAKYTIVDREINRQKIAAAQQVYTDYLWKKSLAQLKELSAKDQNPTAVSSLDQSSSDREVRVLDVLAEQKNSLLVQIPDFDAKPQKPYKFKKIDLERLFALHDRFIQKITEQDTILPPELSQADEIILDEMAKPFIWPRRLIAPVDPKKKLDLLEKSLFEQDDY